ncbi:MAG: Mannose-1-phosphate guanylyltransferase (GDP) [Microgenomates group bacterium GW2011_GWF1_46_12]|nr:MAG: Mannose-1-phosphate guanylyltransferase (GDP) [Microgenomates group bacterium GW2011_GWF1_46_12]
MSKSLRARNVVHDEIKQDQDGNALVTRDQGAEWIGIDTQNSLISTGNKLIVTLGVANLMIVDTGDVLLIVHKDRAQEVKKVVEKLKADHRDDLL